MTTPDALRAFFQTSFGRTSGVLGFAVMSIDKKEFKEHFFDWPRDMNEIVRWVDQKRIEYNVYFCPQLLESRERTKDNVKACTSIWADLDACSPDKLLIEPTFSIESSPGRYQALWVLDEPVDPLTAQDIAMRIAYHHAGQGADRSGWDLTQLLRVPSTFNYKYSPHSFEAPQVTVLKVNKVKFHLSDFEVYPPVKGTRELTLPLPEPTDLPNEEPLDILQRNRYRLNPNAFGLFSQEPGTKSWSEPLWRLLMFCFEAGLTREEVFVVGGQAACNKYARDGKPPTYLWRDVCRAFLRHHENINSIVTSAEQPEIIDDGEIKDLAAKDTFVEQYIRWASGVGDAAVQYHQAGAFVILSSILCGSVRVPTSFGAIIPNLWFMILADTTLTRKTTAMDMAMDMVLEVDEDVLLATDGTIEGMMRSMMMRPGKPSVFLRDEFTGLMEQITKKDYMAGTAELLTKLYDGKPQKRVLSKEVIDVKKPRLIVFAGGIKDRMQSLLTYEHVSSGFMPRFVFITAESQISKVKPLGPPSIRNMGERDFIQGRVRAIYEHYNRDTTLTMTERNLTATTAMQWDAELTPDAWARYGKFEHDMTVAGTSSERADLMVPTYTRLTISGLKAAALLAASRTFADEKVVIEEEDVVRAINYVAGWRDYGNDVLNGIGRTTLEKDLEKVLGSIIRNPGITRSRLMQNHHLTSRTADATFSTLEQRGLITRTRSGNAQAFYPILTGVS